MVFDSLTLLALLSLSSVSSASTALLLFGVFGDEITASASRFLGLTKFVSFVFEFASLLSEVVVVVVVVEVAGGVDKFEVFTGFDRCFS